jgi:hypothetical protein
MPPPWPERRRLTPLRVIFPVESILVSLRAASINSGNVDGGAAILASFNIALL